MNDSPPTASLPSAPRIKSFAIPPPLSALSSHTPMPTPHRPPFTPLTSQLNIPTWSPLTTSKPIPPLHFTPVQSQTMFSPIHEKATHVIHRPILTSSLDASLDTSHAININPSPASTTVSPTPIDTSLDVLLTHPIPTMSSPSPVAFSPIRDDKENVVISPSRNINDEMPLFSPMPATHVPSSVPSTPAPVMAPITSLTPTATTTSSQHPLYQLHCELNTIHSPSSPSIEIPIATSVDISCVEMPIASTDLPRVELRRTSDTERVNVHIHPDVDTSCIVTDTHLLNQSYTSDIDTSICSEMATGAPASTPNVSAFGLLSTSIMDQSVFVPSAPTSPMHTLTSAPLMFSPILDVSRADVSMIQSTPTLDILHQHVTSWCHTLETRITPWDNRYQALQQIRECCISTSVWSSVSQYDMSMALFPLLVPLQTQLSELRSIVVRETCMTIRMIAVRCGSHFQNMAQELLPTLCCLTKVTKRVISIAANECMLVILQTSPLLALTTLIELAMTHRHEIVIIHALDGIKQAIQSWEKEFVATNFQRLLEDATCKLVEHASWKVRECARKMFACMCVLWPRSCSRLSTTFSPRVVAELTKEYPHIMTALNESNPNAAMRRLDASQLSISPQKPVIPVSMTSTPTPIVHDVDGELAQVKKQLRARLSIATNKVVKPVEKKRLSLPMGSSMMSTSTSTTSTSANKMESKLPRPSERRLSMQGRVPGATPSLIPTLKSSMTTSVPATPAHSAPQASMSLIHTPIHTIPDSASSRSIQDRVADLVNAFRTLASPVTDVPLPTTTTTTIPSTCDVDVMTHLRQSDQLNDSIEILLQQLETPSTIENEQQVQVQSVDVNEVQVQSVDGEQVQGVDVDQVQVQPGDVSAQNENVNAAIVEEPVAIQMDEVAMDVAVEMNVDELSEPGTEAIAAEQVVESPVKVAPTGPVRIHLAPTPAPVASLVDVAMSPIPAVASPVHVTTSSSSPINNVSPVATPAPVMTAYSLTPFSPPTADPKSLVRHMTGSSGSRHIPSPPLISPNRAVKNEIKRLIEWSADKPLPIGVTRQITPERVQSVHIPVPRVRIRNNVNKATPAPVPVASRMPSFLTVLKMCVVISALVLGALVWYDSHDVESTFEPVAYQPYVLVDVPSVTEVATPVPVVVEPVVEVPTSVVEETAPVSTPVVAEVVVSAPVDVIVDAPAPVEAVTETAQPAPVAVAPVAAKAAAKWEWYLPTDTSCNPEWAATTVSMPAPTPEPTPVASDVKPVVNEEPVPVTVTSFETTWDIDLAPTVDVTPVVDAPAVASVPTPVTISTPSSIPATPASSPVAPLSVEDIARMVYGVVNEPVAVPEPAKVQPQVQTSSPIVTRTSTSTSTSSPSVLDESSSSTVSEWGSLDLIMDEHDVAPTQAYVPEASVKHVVYEPVIQVVVPEPVVEVQQVAVEPVTEPVPVAVEADTITHPEVVEEPVTHVQIQITTESTVDESVPVVIQHVQSEVWPTYYPIIKCPAPVEVMVPVSMEATSSVQVMEVVEAPVTVETVAETPAIDNVTEAVDETFVPIETVAMEEPVAEVVVPVIETPAQVNVTVAAAPAVTPLVQSSTYDSIFSTLSIGVLVFVSVSFIMWISSSPSSDAVIEHHATQPTPEEEELSPWEYVLSDGSIHQTSFFYLERYHQLETEAAAKRQAEQDAEDIEYEHETYTPIPSPAPAPSMASQILNQVLAKLTPTSLTKQTAPVNKTPSPPAYLKNPSPMNPKRSIFFTPAGTTTTTTTTSIDTSPVDIQRPGYSLLATMQHQPSRVHRLSESFPTISPTTSTSTSTAALAPASTVDTRTAAELMPPPASRPSTVRPRGRALYPSTVPITPVPNKTQPMPSPSPSQSYGGQRARHPAQETAPTPLRRSARLNR